MGSSPRLANQQPVDSNHLKWSGAEKAIARKAFDSALQRELEGLIQETKRRAAGIEKAAELWSLENWLSRRRQQIDRTYDYRYSMLLEVFGNLIYQGRLSEDELTGLSGDKLNRIRLLASL